MLQERDQRRGDGHQLLRRHVHEVDPVRRQERVIVTLAAQHELLGELPLGVERRVGLRHRVPLLLGRGEPADVAGHLAVLHQPVGRLDEPEVVDPGIGRETRDQADVRAFRRLDRAHPPVLGVVHVADLEPRAFPREAARPQSREPPLVRELGQRVGLVHELRELGRPEERLDDRAHGPGVDQVVERDLLWVRVDAHPLLDQPRHAREAHGELVRDELPHAADAPVAKVVDVVGEPAPVVQIDQVADDRDEIVLGEHRMVRRRLEAQTLVDLVAAHPPEVVALRVEEEFLELLPRGLQVGRVARPEQGIDLLQGLGLAVGRVLGQRVLDERRLRAPGRQQHFDFVHALLEQLLLERLGQLRARLGEHFARLRVGHREREHGVVAVPGRGRLLLVPEVDRGVAGEHGHGAHALVPHLVEPLLRELVAHGPEGRAGGILRIPRVLRQERAHHLAPLVPAGHLAGDVELLGREEELENLRVGPVAEGPEQRRGRELLLLVDVDVDHVVNVDRELHPRPAERDDPGREQPLPVGMGVLLEHHTRRAVQLAHDDPLRAVDHERPEGGHDGQLAQVDLLLDDVLRPALALHVLIDDELEGRLKRRRIGHVALDALLDAVLRLAQRVAEEIEAVLAVHVRDREEIAEHALQRYVLAVPLDVVRDQQRLERGRLDVEQVRHRHAALALTERDDGSGLWHQALSHATQ